MRALIIDETAKAAIAAVCEYADENRIDFKEIQARVAIPDGYSPIGDDPNHCCYLVDGFKCVFSVEEQPCGWTRHLSISVAAIDKMPHIEAVKLLMPEFGIEKPLDECHIYIEESVPKSINIICTI
jgi:hypothetical protein